MSITFREKIYVGDELIYLTWEVLEFEDESRNMWMFKAKMIEENRNGTIYKAHPKRTKTLCIPKIGTHKEGKTEYQYDKDPPPFLDEFKQKAIDNGWVPKWKPKEEQPPPQGEL